MQQQPQTNACLPHALNAAAPQPATPITTTQTNQISLDSRFGLASTQATLRNLRKQEVQQQQELLDQEELQRKQEGDQQYQQQLDHHHPQLLENDQLQQEQEVHQQHLGQHQHQLTKEAGTRQAAGKKMPKQPNLNQSGHPIIGGPQTVQKRELLQKSQLSQQIPQQVQQQQEQLVHQASTQQVFGREVPGQKIPKMGTPSTVPPQRKLKEQPVPGSQQKQQVMEHQQQLLQHQHVQQEEEMAQEGFTQHVLKLEVPGHELPGQQNSYHSSMNAHLLVGGPQTAQGQETALHGQGGAQTEEVFQYHNVTYQGKQGKMTLSPSGLSFAPADPAGGKSFQVSWEDVKKHRLSSPTGTQPSLRLTVLRNYGEGEEQETNSFGLSSLQDLEILGMAIDMHRRQFKQMTTMPPEKNRKGETAKKGGPTMVASSETESTVSISLASTSLPVTDNTEVLGASDTTDPTRALEQGTDDDLVRLVYEHLRATSMQTNRILQAIYSGRRPGMEGEEQDSMAVVCQMDQLSTVSQLTSPTSEVDVDHLSIPSVREPTAQLAGTPPRNSSIARTDSEDSREHVLALARQFDQADRMAKAQIRKSRVQGRQATGEGYRETGGGEGEESSSQVQAQLKQQVLELLKQSPSFPGRREEEEEDEIHLPGAHPAMSQTPIPTHAHVSRLVDIPESEEEPTITVDPVDDASISNGHLIQAYLVAQAEHQPSIDVPKPPDATSETSSNPDTSSRKSNKPQFWELSEAEFLSALETVMVNKCQEAVPLDKDIADLKKDISFLRAAVNNSVTAQTSSGSECAPSHALSFPGSAELQRPNPRTENLISSTQVPNQQAACCVIL